MKKLMTLGAIAFDGAVFAVETLLSPDGTIKVTVDAERAEPMWPASRKSAELVKPSRMGLDFIGQSRWANFKLKNASRRTIDSTWKTRLYKKETVRNDVILNLNPPPEDGMDFSWVEPGASSWDWWVESNNSLSTELTIKLVDFAAEMGWKYHTIDGGRYGWARRPNHGPDVPVKIRKGFDLHKIIAHAKEKNVGVWVWLHWEAVIYADGPNAATDAADVAESVQVFVRNSKLTIELAPEGGAVAVFCPKKK